MDAKLKPLFIRLRKDNKSALADIATLTAPHIFGIISRRVKERTKAETVLRQFYKHLWDVRHNTIFASDDVLDVLRAYAHHCAIKANMTCDGADINFFAQNENLNASKNHRLGKEIELNRQELRTAYLKDVQKGGISK